MAANCPFWKSGRCVPAGATSGSDCSFPGRDYERCCVYGTVGVRASGASLRDTVLYQDKWLRRATYISRAPKKWWQFWK